MVVISSCDEIRAAKSTGGGDGGGSIVLCYTLALRQKYRIHFHEKNSRRAAAAGWLLKNTFLLSMPFLEARNY